MTTMRDVAKQAGVSPTTVSRVINRSGYVSQETRERVLAAIQELGYVPNVLARSLRSKQTKTLGLILADITNPFWTTVSRGAEDAANKAGFNVILCNTDESEDKQEQYLNVLLQKRVDGVLLVPASSATKAVGWVQSQGTALVVLDRRVECAQVDVVRGDSEGGAYQLVRYLLSLGHERIAALSGPADVSTSADRVAGYRRALQEAGQGVQPDWVCYGHYSQASGYEMAQRALALTPRPTALFACNNFIAIGALRALRHAGLRVPEDVSVVSFDDLTSDLVIEPFLTVADQLAYEMGRQGTELLVERLTNRACDGCREVVLPTEIIVRGSTGPPP